MTCGAYTSDVFMVVTARGVAPSPHIIMFDILHVALHVCMRPASVHAPPLSRMLTCRFSVSDIGGILRPCFLFRDLPPITSGHHQPDNTITIVRVVFLVVLG